MLILSSLVKFSIYCLFIILSVNYLTKNYLDDTSKYLVMGLLIVPYLYIDSLNEESYENTSESFSVKLPKIGPNIFKQPEIILSKHEEIVNKNVEEEIKIKNNKQEHFDNNSLTGSLSDEQMKKIISLVKNELKQEIKQNSIQNSIIEHLDASSTQPVSNVSLSSDPALQPLGMDGPGFTNGWDQDYVLLSTDKWAPTMKPAPICKAEKECPVCPSLTTGYPLNLKEFDSSRKITQPVP